jgi:hypothetical protein
VAKMSCDGESSRSVMLATVLLLGASLGVTSVQSAESTAADRRPTRESNISLSEAVATPKVPQNTQHSQSNAVPPAKRNNALLPAVQSKKKLMLNPQPLPPSPPPPPNE